MVEPLEPTLDEGGETSCYAHLLCLECGAVLDGSEHHSGCSSLQVSESPGEVSS